MPTFRLLISTAFFLIFCVQVNAQLLDPVSYQITEAPSQVKAGERFLVTIRADIEGQWHLYSALNDPDAGPYPTTFSSIEDNLFIAGSISETEPRIVLDPNFNEKLGWHSEYAYFTIPLVFDIHSHGANPVVLDILYQVCDDKSCLPPKTKQVFTEISVAGIAENPFEVKHNAISLAEGREWKLWLLVILIGFGLYLFSRRFIAN